MSQQTDSAYAVCQCCKKQYPKTKEYFYTCNGKLRTSNCKPCKKKKTADYAKNNKDKVNELRRKYYYKNRDKEIKRVAKYKKDYRN